MVDVGFIGLGLMGTLMARRLLDAGYRLTVWNRTPAKAQRLIDAGATWVGSPGEAAKSADLVITMVTDSAAVREVSAGILEGAQPGLIHVDMSSVDPDTSRSVAQQAAKAGVGMLDAPVTGSTPQAADGTLGIMVGGDRAHYEKALPVLEHLGKKIVYAGPSGAGTTVKLINQVMFAAVMAVGADALVLAAKAGVDPQLVLDVLAAGGARTTALDTRGPRILDRDFAPRFSLANQYKDLVNALAMAKGLGVPVPGGDAIGELYRTAVEQGKGDLDSAVVVTVLEDLAQVTVGLQP